LEIKNFLLHQAVCKKSFGLIQVLLPPFMPYELTMFSYDCINENFAKGFLFKQHYRQ